MQQCKPCVPWKKVLHLKESISVQLPRIYAAAMLDPACFVVGLIRNLFETYVKRLL